MEAVAVALPQRTVTAGDVIEVLVLGMGAGEVLGVDLASGAFVRSRDPGGPPLSPFDVVRLEVVDGEPLLSPHAPELVEVTDDPAEPVGRLTGRRAERILRPLLDPRGEHLLGVAASSVPYWTLTGDRPSMALVTPTMGPVVVGTRQGFRCRFVWRDRVHDLPLFDAPAMARLEACGVRQGDEDTLGAVLGFRPSRVLVSLSPPYRGHCYKVAAGLLPRP